jgi:hypothetical protein
MISREKIWNKSEGRCSICGKNIDIRDMTADHMIPQCKGGTGEDQNIVPTCKKCNGDKGNLIKDPRDEYKFLKPEELKKSFEYFEQEAYKKLFSYDNPLVLESMKVGVSDKILRIRNYSGGLVLGEYLEWYLNVCEEDLGQGLEVIDHLLLGGGAYGYCKEEELLGIFLIRAEEKKDLLRIMIIEPIRYSDNYNWVNEALREIFKRVLDISKYYSYKTISVGIRTKINKTYFSIIGKKSDYIISGKGFAEKVVYKAKIGTKKNGARIRKDLVNTDSTKIVEANFTVEVNKKVSINNVGALKIRKDKHEVGKEYTTKINERIERILAERESQYGIQRD